MKGAVAGRAEHGAIAAVFFINGFGFASWVSRIPAVRDGLGLGEGELGTALLGMGLGALCAFQLTGRALAHAPARRVTLVTGLLFCLSLIGPGLAGSWPLLAMCLFLMGAVNGAMDVAMNALAVEVELRCGRPIMSGLHGLWSAGALGGAAAGSLVVQQGVPVAVHLGVAAAAMAGGLLAARPALPALPPQPPERKPRFAFPERAAWGLGGVVLCAFLIEGAMADWAALHLQDSLGTSASVAALGYGAFSLAMMVLRLAGDRLVTRVRAASLLQWANGAAALLLAAALATGQVALTMVAFVAVGLGVAVVAPLVFSAAARRSRHGAGQGIAAMATLGYGGFLLGPPLIGWLAQATSLRLALGVLVGLAAGIALLAHHLDEPAG